MDIQTILNELKKEGWFFDEDFIKNNEDMLQAITDKTLALQLQQTGVIKSVCNSCGGKKIKLENGFERCEKCQKLFA